MIDKFIEPIYGETIFEIKAKNQMAIVDKNTLAIRVTHMDGSVNYVFIDVNDFDKCKDHYWYAVKDRNVYYAMAKIMCSDGVVRMVKMHRYLMFDDPLTSDRNIMIDHINHNGLDNRRCNLRYCNNRQNQWNAKLTAQNTTGVLGVSYSDKRKTYYASIRLETGDRLHKTFSVNKYGNDEAFKLAKEQRAEWEKIYRY